MKRSPLALSGGVVLLAGGLIWVLQGFDVSFAPRSFMTDNRWWVIWGVVAMCAGGLIIWRGKNH